MNHIISFYGEAHPDGNLIKWVIAESPDGAYVLEKSKEGVRYAELLAFDSQSDMLKALSNGAASIKKGEYLDDKAGKGVTYYKLLNNNASDAETPVISVERKGGFSLYATLARLLLFGLILFLGYQGMKSLSSQKKPPPKIRPTALTRYVKVAPVAYKNHATSVEALGKVVSSQPLDIVSEVSGRLLPANLELNKAQTFAKGDVLFYVDSREASLALQAQRSTFLNAIACLITRFENGLSKSL